MKRFLSLIAIVCVAFAFTSCDVESKTKSHYEGQADKVISIMEEIIDMAEAEKEHLEWVLELDDEEFEEYCDNMADWQEDAIESVEDDGEEVQDKMKDIVDDLGDIVKDLYRRADKLDIELEGEFGGDFINGMGMGMGAFL